jgi:hypothetical protein
MLDVSPTPTTLPLDSMKLKPKKSATRHNLGEHSKAAIREHRKTGHTEVVARDVDGAWRQASLQRHEQRIERR